jgi:hypothetical protein
MNVPQQTSSGPQPFVREHSNCVVVVHRESARHVPNAELGSEMQQVSAVEQAAVVYGLQDFPASVVEASRCLLAPFVDASAGSPASAPNRVLSFGETPHATISQASADNPGQTFELPIPESSPFQERWV